MTNTTITTKHKQTGAAEIIKQRDLRMEDWGFTFFVDSELEAFKAAYVYRHNPYGVLVEFAQGARSWMVTVFNSSAADSGIDGARKIA